MHGAQGAQEDAIEILTFDTPGLVVSGLGVSGFDTSGFDTSGSDRSGSLGRGWEPQAFAEEHESSAPPLLQTARPVSGYERSAKPILDRLMALVLVVALSPFLVFVALMVRVKLGPGVIYRQHRIGRGGVPFKMYKFRTMGHDRRRDGSGKSSPDRRSRDDRRQLDTAIDHPDPRADWQRRQPDFGRRRSHKTLDDPRHTDLGRFLRASSLDELPQLVNVLRGELSLVGPRPELPEVVVGYQPFEHARHQVKPGITGLWQVTERSDDRPMHEHVDTDLRYVQELSLVMDVRILLMTMPALLGLSARARGR